MLFRSDGDLRRDIDESLVDDKPDSVLRIVHDVREVGGRLLVTTQLLHHVLPQLLAADSLLQQRWQGQGHQPGVHLHVRQLIASGSRFTYDITENYQQAPAMT